MRDLYIKRRHKKVGIGIFVLVIFLFSSSLTADSSLLYILSEYSVFATHSLWLKQNSEIISGSVGVNEPCEAPFLDSNVELSVGMGVKTPLGYALSANRIKVQKKSIIKSLSDIWDLIFIISSLKFWKLCKLKDS